ncbi:Cytochrome P450 [Venustampulla echinocandica]|uniref:Cytochrome P450 n=1 Tax=Venustampulla echinocandica TaxID=2656787 RepID=A0A370TLQ0_9HELO|nr:Cytochrome P450 [Venustampulla echinocandica]RDL36450.1 Cytochrome P450 [Venustampulla echinocandica]
MKMEGSDRDRNEDDRHEAELKPTRPTLAIMLFPTTNLQLFQAPLLQFCAYAILALTLLFLFVFRRPAHPLKAPKLLSISENYPVLGAVRFFTARLEFFRDGIRNSASGNFCFWLGQHFIVGLSGDESRQVFFQNLSFGIAEGYAVLFGGGPRVKNDKGSDVAQEPGFLSYFARRVTHLLRREYLAKNIRPFIHDIQARLDELPSQTGMTDPFVSIYEIVFQLTMRMVGCAEIANDTARLRKTLRLFETIEQSTTPTSIIFPWMPTLALFKRTIAGGRLYRLFKGIMDDRKKTGRREDDALQYLMDMGDNIKSVIQFIVGAVFAGQLNTGINASFMLTYIGSSRYWYDRVRAEIDAVVYKYAPDRSMPLTQRFEAIPIEAWESEFPLLDCCLKDSIRLQLLGTMYRRHVGIGDVKVGNEVIPSGAFVTYHFSDVHQDPSIYSEPLKWDPSRYFPERAEDKTKPFCWLGWGAGRHPCLGTRFAKLEQFLIVAIFLTRFDYDTCDDKGVPYDAVPPPDLNAHAATKPTALIRLRYRPRELKM